jgi:hypothetical protein
MAQQLLKSTRYRRQTRKDGSSFKTKNYDSFWLLLVPLFHFIESSNRQVIGGHGHLRIL